MAVMLRERYGIDNRCAKKNATGSTIVRGSCVQLDTTTDQVVLPSASTAAQFAIVVNDLLTGTYGDVQTGPSKAIGLAGGAITVGAKVMPATSGKLVAFSAAGGVNAACVGVAATAAAADGDLFEIELAAPFNVIQG